MNIFGQKIKIFTLLVLVITITLSAIPISTASAVGFTTDDIPPTESAKRTNRLAFIWERLQRTYDRQGLRLDRADNLLDNLQSRVDLANDNGKDTAAVQAALDLFSQAIKDVNPIHQSAKGIIASHKGFDSDGKVTDRIQALETVHSLGQSIKEVRDLVRDPFKLLQGALTAFREANRSE